MADHHNGFGVEALGFEAPCRFWLRLPGLTRHMWPGYSPSVTVGRFRKGVSTPDLALPTPLNSPLGPLWALPRVSPSPPGWSTVIAHSTPSPGGTPLLCLQRCVFGLSRRSAHFELKNMS